MIRLITLLKHITEMSTAAKLLSPFLLLARYVPNVAKRSIWDQWK